MLKGMFGVNIAVRDLDQAITKYEALLGVKPQMAQPEDFAFPGIKGAGFDFNGFLIALLSSDDENNPVGSFLKKRGEGVLLLSLRSDNIDSDVDALRSKGIDFLLPDNYEGPSGKANFVPPKGMHGVQLEVIEPAGKLKQRS